MTGGRGHFLFFRGHQDKRSTSIASSDIQARLGLCPSTRSPYVTDLKDSILTSNLDSMLQPPLLCVQSQLGKEVFIDIRKFLFLLLLLIPVFSILMYILIAGGCFLGN